MAVPKVITKEYADYVIGNILKGIGARESDFSYELDCGYDDYDDYEDADDCIEYEVYISPPEYYIGPVTDYTRMVINIPLFIFDCTSLITFYIDAESDDDGEEIAENFISGEYASPILYIMDTPSGEYLAFEFMDKYLYIDIPDHEIITLGSPSLGIPLLSFTKLDHNVKMVAF